MKSIISVQNRIIEDIILIIPIFLDRISGTFVGSLVQVSNLQITPEIDPVLFWKLSSDKVMILCAH